MCLPHREQLSISEEKIRGCLLNPSFPDRVVMIMELERIMLTAPLALEGLAVGNLGTVVRASADGKTFEVEFVTQDGHTTVVATVEAVHVRPVTRRDMANTREMQPV